MCNTNYKYYKYYHKQYSIKILITYSHKFNYLFSLLLSRDVNDVRKKPSCLKCIILRWVLFFLINMNQLFAYETQIDKFWLIFLCTCNLLINWATSITWTRTLDLDPDPKNLDSERPGPKKTWTLKNLK